MTEKIGDWVNDIHQGDAAETLAAMPESSVHMAMCSPPYYGLRDYIVLDSFAGAGTTCLEAKRLGRRFVGIDLNPDYVAMAQKRVGVTVDEPGRLLEDGEQPLTAYTDGGEP